MARKRPVQGSRQRGLLEGGVSENEEEKPGEGKGKHIREQVQILGRTRLLSCFQNQKERQRGHCAGVREAMVLSDAREVGRWAGKGPG